MSEYLLCSKRNLVQTTSECIMGEKLQENQREYPESICVHYEIVYNERLLLYGG